MTRRRGRLAIGTREQAGGRKHFGAYRAPLRFRRTRDRRFISRHAKTCFSFTAQDVSLKGCRVTSCEQFLDLGVQGTAWALERLYPHRFARPEVMNQIAVVSQGDKVSTERVIVLPGEEFNVLIGRPGYHLCENGDLERREGSFVYVMVRQQSNRALPMGE
jgi:hypothetical protein